MDAETKHNLAITALRVPFVSDFLRGFYPCKKHPVKVAGITFPNRVGLAAGFDKNGVALDGLSALGFGHIEIGTVTLSGRTGNKKPRVFKRNRERLITNRMGLPNDGALQIFRRIKSLPHTKIGVSIGDYFTHQTELFNESEADYIALNVSCPNVKTKFNDMDLEHIFNDCKRVAKKPLFVKLPGDDSGISFGIETIKQAEDAGMSGFIVANSKPVFNGGLSGEPIYIQNLRMVDSIRKQTELPIIGCGGILSVHQAKQYLNAGASLVQIYSGLVFNGPSFPSTLVKGIHDA